MASGRRAKRAYLCRRVTAMPNTETLTDAAETLPASAYRATRYADWTDSVFCTVSACRYVARLLTDEQRRRALAAFELATLPHWTIVDVGQLGAAAYRSPASAPAAYSPFGAMVLSAMRRLRRWHAYADEPLSAPAPNLPLDGCHCRVCQTRE